MEPLFESKCTYTKKVFEEVTKATTPPVFWAVGLLAIIGSAVWGIKDLQAGELPVGFFVSAAVLIAFLRFPITTGRREYLEVQKNTGGELKTILRFYEDCLVEENLATGHTQKTYYGQLTRIKETKRLLLLMPSSTVAIVISKDGITKGNLDALREFLTERKGGGIPAQVIAPQKASGEPSEDDGKGAPLIENHVLYGYEALMELQRGLGFAKSIAMLCVLLAASALCMAAIIINGFSLGIGVLGMVALLLTLFYLYHFFFGIKQGARKQARAIMQKNGGQTPENALRFYPDALYITNLHTGATERYAYEAIERVIETKAMLLLVMNKYAAIPLDKAGFTRGDMQAFFAFAQKAIPNAKIKRKK